MSTIREDLVAVMKKIKIESSKPYFSGYRLQNCLICGMLCIDPDPTGLTCGQKKCLSELLTIYLDQKEGLKNLFEKHISDDDLASDISYEELLSEMEEALIDFNIVKADIAKQLGLDKSEIESKLRYLSDIENELAGDPEELKKSEEYMPSILELTKRVAGILDISTEGTLREILENIEGEIKIIKTEIKKLIK